MSTIDGTTFFIPQENFRVGDIKFNKQKIIQHLREATEEGYDFVVFPELAFSGYPPRDLLYYTSFTVEIEEAIGEIASETGDTAVIFGAPRFDNRRRLRNSAVVAVNGEVVYTYYKTLLPDYDVFDESRYFYPSSDPGIVEVKGIRIGLQVCEDLWDHLWMHGLDVSKRQVEAGAEILLNISASPYTISKAENRLNIVKKKVEALSVPFLYVNLVGSQDDIVFDGRSFFVDSTGELVFTTPAFETGNYLLEVGCIGEGALQNYLDPSPVSGSYEAIKMNLDDYLNKSGLQRKLLVALSGGLDSALTLALATEVVGSENIYAVYLPTSFSADQSYSDSKELCDNLGIPLEVIEIEELRQLFDAKLRGLDRVNDRWSVADENIQSRIRSNIVMYLSNKEGRILISTGNKSEIATGYCTLYGDTAGGKNLIGDLYKTEVYEMAKHVNRNGEIIPEAIIERPPTAELKPDQKDTDSLPEYDELDAILKLFIDGYKTREEIVELGYDRDTVDKVVRLVLRNEFKRDQMVQTVKVSDKAFGSGWRQPIASRFVP